MNFKLAYALASTENDVYLEQALLSMYSAKYHMPDAKITLVVDDGTEASLTGHRRKILDYVDELVSIPFDKKYNNRIRSRLLKINLRSYIKGDFLYIDCDTIVCGDLSGLDNVSAPVSAVWDRHCIPRKSPSYKRIKRKLKKVNCGDVDFYFNGGVILVRDCEISREFYATWDSNYRKYVKTVQVDQPALALSQQQLNFRINTLPGEYNCQIENGIRYFKDMKIMHYYAAVFLGGSKEFLSAFQDSRLYDELKQTGCISDSLKNLILHPELSLAEPACLFPSSNLFTTRMFNQLRRMYRYEEHNFFITIMLAFVKFIVTIVSFICLGIPRLFKRIFQNNKNKKREQT